MVRKALVFLIGFTSLSIPQQLSAGWTRTYGSQAWEYGSSIHQTPDGGYIVGGYKENVPGGEGDLWLLKTNPSGDTSWTRAYGGEGDDYGTYVEMTSDGGYILAGECESWDYGGWLIKTDAVGDTQWTYSHGGWSGFNSVRETSDGGYIAVGYEEGASLEDVLLVKLDANGLVKWIKTHGGIDMDWGTCVEQTADGGYIVSASTYSFGAGEADLWVLKTDEFGDTTWTRTYGGADYDWGGWIIQTSDGGYAALCDAGSFGKPNYSYAWLLKLKEDGDTAWSRLYITDEAPSFYGLHETPDAGYILAGELGTVEAANAWIVKTDENGDSLWTRSYGYDSEWDMLGGVDLTSDGGYVFVGETNSFDAGNGDLWIVKTDSLGDTLGSFVVEKPTSKTPTDWQIVKSVGRQIVLRYTDHPQGFNADIFDASGRKVDELRCSAPSGSITWGGAAPAGVYFIRSLSDDVATTKRAVLLE